MAFEIFKWSVAVASLVGVVLNVQHRRECFFIWACTNAAWTVIDLYHGIWSQAMLQAIYFGLSIWGFLKWKHGGDEKLQT